MALTVLIVDDSEDDHRLYRRALRAADFRLVSALSAAEGLARVEDERPDVILLDFNLPDMSGLGFLGKYEGSGQTSAPVIMLTGEGNESVAVAAMKAGASDYLVKDVEGGYLRLLTNVVHRACAAHEERMRARRLDKLNEAILGTVADGIVGIDADGRIRFANSASERMLLFDLNQLNGRHLTELLRQTDPRADWTAHPLSKPHDGSASVHRECDLFQRAGGTSFPVGYTASPLDFEGDGRYGWVLVFHDISERKQAEEELIKTARYDTLTGLPNRLMFQDYLSKSLARVARNQQHLALFFLDLDGFKAVNDNLGHLAGDKLLQLVAQRLVKCVREGDLVSRFGGDEFTIILEDCDAAKLVAFAQRIVHELEEPFNLDGQIAQISASAGMTLFPECGCDETTLIQSADAAMYKAKKSGKNGYGLCGGLESILNSLR